MSELSRAGQRVWEQRKAQFPAELAAQIRTRAQADYDQWAEAGRVPAWMAIKGRITGRPVPLPPA
jgi:hypothetical protein